MAPPLPTTLKTAVAQLGTVTADTTVEQLWKLILDNGGGNESTRKNALLFQPNTWKLLKLSDAKLSDYGIIAPCKIEMIPRPRG